MATLDLSPFAPFDITGFTISTGLNVAEEFGSPGFILGIFIPPGERLLDLGPWTLTVDVTSAADTATVELTMGTTGWTVTSDTSPVAANGSQSKFIVGGTNFSPRAGPGMPLGQTVITVSHGAFSTLDADNYNDGGLHAPVFGYVADGATGPTLAGPSAATIDLVSTFVDYTTEVDPALQVWHAIEPGDGYTVTTGPGSDWDFPHDGSNGPHLPPGDYLGGKPSSINMEVEVISDDPGAESMLTFRVRTSDTGPSGVAGGFGFEAVPDDPLVFGWASGPGGGITEWGSINFQNDPGGFHHGTFGAADGPVAVQFPFYERTAIAENSLLAVVDGPIFPIPPNYNGTWRINLLDVWYAVDVIVPPPAGFGWRVGAIGMRPI